MYAVVKTGGKQYKVRALTLYCFPPVLTTAYMGIPTCFLLRNAHVCSGQNRRKTI